MTNATPEKRRCPRCGRELLNGLTDCYNCINNERYAKRSGRKLSSASEKYASSRRTKQRKSAPKTISKQSRTAPLPKPTRPKRKSNRTRTRRSTRRAVVDSLPISPIDSASMSPSSPRKPFTLKQRAEGFNRLLSDIYERPTTTSKVLQQSSHGPALLDAITNEPQKMIPLFDQIETKLYEILRAEEPNLDPSVLNIWYGLSTHRNATHQAIAAQLTITVDDVAETRTAYLQHLRTPATIATLEQIIRQAAHQAIS